MGTTIPIAPHVPLVHAHEAGGAILLPVPCSCGRHKPIQMSEDETRALAGVLLAVADGLPVSTITTHGGD